MSKASTPSPNPRRVAAGKLNQLKWKGLTPQGRLKKRMAALKHQPWRFSTGPRTKHGKARSAANGRYRQLKKYSVRELRAEVAEVQQLIDGLRDARMSSLTTTDTQ